MLTSAGMKGLEEMISPKPLGFEETKAGEPKGFFARWHKHRYKYVRTLGLTDLDPPEISFSMGTYSTLFRCSCGAEKVERTRALI